MEREEEVLMEIIKLLEIINTINPYDVDSTLCNLGSCSEK